MERTGRCPKQQWWLAGVTAQPSLGEHQLAQGLVQMNFWNLEGCRFHSLSRQPTTVCWIGISTVSICECCLLPTEKSANFLLLLLLASHLIFFVFFKSKYPYGPSLSFLCNYYVINFLFSCSANMISLSAIVTAAIHIGMILNAELRLISRIWAMFWFCRQGQRAASIDTGHEPLA